MIHELFSPEAQQEILSLIKSGNTKQLPHIYMIAGKAFQNMKNR
jgi:myosin heavy subunit